MSHRIIQPLFTPVRMGKLELPNRIVMAPLTRMRAESAMQQRKIFRKFRGNSSLTVKGSLTPVTRTFRIRTKLFPNATGG